jgi:hypothetical protein
MCDGFFVALAVDDRGARLVVLLLGDPPLLAGGERGEDDAADPHGRYLRSGRAMILTFMEAGASAVSSLQKRVYDLLRAFRERPAALGFRKSLVGSPQSSNRLHASRIAQKPQNSQNRAVEGLESVRRPRAPGSRHFTPPCRCRPSRRTPEVRRASRLQCYAPRLVRSREAPAWWRSTTGRWPRARSSRTARSVRPCGGWSASDRSFSHMAPQW